MNPFGTSDAWLHSRGGNKFTELLSVTAGLCPWSRRPEISPSVRGLREPFLRSAVHKSALNSASPHLWGRPHNERRSGCEGPQLRVVCPLQLYRWRGDAAVKVALRVSDASPPNPGDKHKHVGCTGGPTVTWRCQSVCACNPWQANDSVAKWCLMWNKMNKSYKYNNWKWYFSATIEQSVKLINVFIS